MQRANNIAIIGAGITGLALADRLVKEGRTVTLFDKGRALGGRIATRRTPRGLFDHGAPQLDATGQDFRGFLDRLGAVSNRNHRYFGPTGMRMMFDSLREALNVQQSVRVTGVEKEQEGWVLTSKEGRVFAHFDSLILTIPAPQAADLIVSVDPVLADRVAEVEMSPVWTCMVEFDGPLSHFDLPEKGPVLVANRMGDKPGRDDVREAWVIHMTPDYTREVLEADPIVQAPRLLSAFADACGLDLPDIAYLSAHRWRYAFVDEPFGRPFLLSEETGLLVGGDWTLGRRAENGFESASAMADYILSDRAAND